MCVCVCVCVWVGGGAWVCEGKGYNDIIICYFETIGHNMLAYQCSGFNDSFTQGRWCLETMS